MYYGLSAETLWIFCAGAFAFSVGSAVALTLPAPPARPRSFSAASNRSLNCLFGFVLLGLPFAVAWIARAAIAQGANNFFLGAYRTFADRSNQDNFGYIAFQNFGIVATAVAMIAFQERASGKRRSLYAVLLAFGLNILTGSRNGFVPLICSLLCLDWLKTRRIRWKQLFASVAFLCVLACTMAIYVGKNGASADASVADNIRPVAYGLIYYATGPMAAYDQVVRSPHIVPHFLGIDRFFTHLLHRIDSRFQDLYMAIDWDSTFVCTGPGQCTMNVFTLYFAYIDLGAFGSILTVFFLGWVATATYRSALAGAKISGAMFALLFPAIILSLFQEYFFVALNYLLKMYGLFWLVYSLPGLIGRFGNNLRLGPTAFAASQPSPRGPKVQGSKM
jgi:oligosaccharide repeat unit polymerase